MKTFFALSCAAGILSGCAFASRHVNPQTQQVEPSEAEKIIATAKAINDATSPSPYKEILGYTLAALATAASAFGAGHITGKRTNQLNSK